MFKFLRNNANSNMPAIKMMPTTASTAYAVGDALALKNCITLLSVARVKPGGFSPIIRNYIFASSQIKRFCP